MRPVQQKSTFEIWQRWAKVLVRQLDQVGDVYEYHEDTTDAAQVNALSARIKLFIDPLAHAPELAKLDYDVKGSVDKLYLLSMTMLQKHFQEALNMLPEISEDMQRLLNSPYQGTCNGRVASDIFKGPHGTTNEGIGSGVPDERGGLPWMIKGLLDEADYGGEEYLTRGLDSRPSATATGDGPDRHDGPMRSTRRMASGGGFE
jgi:hypothetical protein